MQFSAGECTMRLSRSNWFLALLICSWSLSAKAESFSVTTQTNANVPGATSVAGYGSSSGASGDNTTGTATFTYSGSPNVLGLTSSFDSLTTSAGGYSTSSYSAGDLATGVVRDSLATSFYASSSSELTDTLTFNIPGVDQSTVTPITVSYALDGTFVSSAGGDLDSKLEFDNAILSAQWTSQIAPSLTQDGGWSSQNLSCLTTSCLDFQGVIGVTGPNPVVNVDLYLSLACDPSGTPCSEDYSNTGMLSLSLPAGVTTLQTPACF